MFTFVSPLIVSKKLPHFLALAHFFTFRHNYMIYLKYIYNKGTSMKTKLFKRIITLGLGLSLSILTGCAGNSPHSGAQTGAMTGALAGAAIGYNTKGHHSGRRAVIGSLIGATVGHAIGNSVDNQTQPQQTGGWQ
jgi:phage tail tape-measure protein